MLSELVKLANQLDQKGLFEEADKIDHLITMATTNFSKSNLIRALKNNDADAAKKALTGMSGDDLGLDHDDFRILSGVIQSAKNQEFSNPDEYHKNMNVARQILGIGKNVKLDPLTHSPFSGQPWGSSPTPIPKSHDGVLDKDQLKFLWKKMKSFPVNSDIYIGDIGVSIGNSVKGGTLDIKSLPSNEQEMLHEFLSDAIDHLEENISVEEKLILGRIYKDLEYLWDMYG